jgi:hypothetical protein
MMPSSKAVIEYGAGHYGAVYPTVDPNVVLKITSDPSESRFVRWILSQPELEEEDGPCLGIVRYYHIIRLPRTYRGRPVDAIWRESAVAVGWHDTIKRMLSMDEAENYIRNQMHELEGHLSFLKKIGNKMRMRIPAIALSGRDPSFLREAWSLLETIDDQYDFGSESLWQGIDSRRMPKVEKVAIYLKMFGDTCEIMTGSWASHRIGETMSWAFQNGVVIADLHQGNIGLVEREGVVPVITDPGHAIFFGE